METSRRSVYEQISKGASGPDYPECALALAFDVNSVNGVLKVQGERGKCSFLYHYYLHPQFGWMFVRLQTWFPFEIQFYVNGRDWLARQMDREGLSYRSSDNKFLWVEDWPRAQELLHQQLETSWPTA